MSEHSWTVREATPDDFALARDLYRTVWGFERPAAYDRWKYRMPPIGAAPTAVAVDGDRLAGFFTAWPSRMAVGDGSALGVQAMDVMTHPDYRGQGIFVTLARACFEIAARRGFDILFGFPNPAAFPGYVRHLDCAHIGDVAQWIRPVQPSRHPRMPRPLGPFADAAVLLWPKGRTGSYAVALAPPSPADLARLLATWCPGKGVCRIERTPEWLDWRYAPAAAMGYEWITASRSGQVLAAGVLGMKDESWGPAVDGRAHVTELLGEDPGAVSAVLAGLIDRARARGAWLIESVGNVPSVVRALKRAGFVSHRRAPLIVRRLGDRELGVDIDKIDSWRFVGGDLDTF